MMDQKLKMLIVLALLFALLASPFAYNLTNMLGSRVGLDTKMYSGCATPVGLAIHAVLFALIVRILMSMPDMDMC